MSTPSPESFVLVDAIATLDDEVPVDFIRSYIERYEYHNDDGHNFIVGGKRMLAILEDFGKGLIAEYAARPQAASPTDSKDRRRYHCSLCETPHPDARGRCPECGFNGFTLTLADQTGAASPAETGAGLAVMYQGASPAAPDPSIEQCELCGCNPDRP